VDKNSNYNIEWSVYTALFFQSIGIKHVCISPGARNSPLTYAFTEKTKIECYSNVDERSSAFFALGLAKVSNLPVILLSTSGTAPANYYPAIIEASMGRWPLVVLSADRPNYLINTGENQTINQQHLYGNFVRYFADVGIPINKYDRLEHILQRAISKSMGLESVIPPGPVHLNFPFEEPLIIKKLETFSKYENNPQKQLKQKSIIRINKLRKIHKPLIVVGPMENNSFQEHIMNLSKKIHAPIFADPLSQMRYGFSNSAIISHYDIFLRNIDIKPGVIIRFGRKPTSKILCQFLKKYKDKTTLVDPWEKFNDDSLNYNQSPIDKYCSKDFDVELSEDSKKWFKKILYFEDKVEQEISVSELFHEGMAARVCTESIESGGTFIIGNSMPIRDVDMFTSTLNKQFDVYANRGSSGIDGIISTALGISKHKKNKYSILLIGDLSFFHDMNGLSALQYKMDLTIVVINNSGGGIFSFLPISKLNLQEYDKYWKTDTGISIQKVSDLYNCKYYIANDLQQLGKYIKNSFSIDGIKIIEIKTSIEENVDSHNYFLNNIKNILLET